MLKQEDVQNIYHLQMPRWLFTDPKYMVLETKAACIFLEILLSLDVLPALRPERLLQVFARQPLSSAFSSGAPMDGLTTSQ